MKISFVAVAVVIETDEQETSPVPAPKPSPLEQLLMQLSAEPEEKKGLLNGKNIAVRSRTGDSPSGRCATVGPVSNELDER